MRYLKLLGASFSLSLRQELAFRANLVFQLLLSAFGIASGLAMLGIVYTQTATLDGWSLREAIIVLGTFQIVGGISATFVEPNVGFFSGQINTGQLDHVLLRPLSSLYMVSLGKAAPLELSQVLIGLLVIALGLGELPSWWGLLGWLILVATGIVVAWATRVLLACLAFWMPSLELAVFYHALWQFARYPVTIYRQPLRFIFTYILPFAFIATFPAGVLTGRAGALLLLPGVALSVAAIILVRLVWQAGLRRYTSATS